MDFTQIAIFLVIAAIVGVIAKSLRQPPLVGYLFAGIILSLGGFIKDTPTLSSLAQIGVTLLLFLLGMEMNLKDIPDSSEEHPACLQQYAKEKVKK